ncbi:hypothetical protein COLO4_26018 [Corchorus olitorius]|uniref:TIR domain-containing protein n=1 Tax=Corchorus olitorius TaxID=93759 RepID=A0A1R3HYY0_9ROSI|nr:hypothetical protein COLO4_26018 [Corchorus olitorius]
MASSSSSSSWITPIGREREKYEVFLSFRGEDTRNKFTSHLHHALRLNKIETFIDDDGLSKGEEISPALFRAIQESKVLVIIFSENFASSTWCLDEVVNIMNQSKKNYSNQQIVIPVFYDVDPSIVRKQTGSFAVAFDKHERNFKDDNSQKVDIWRNALREAANLSGWDSNTTRPEATLVAKIVEDISKKLDHVTPKIKSWQGGLVGIEKRVNKVIALLALGSQDTRTRRVGIWGMGGIGKTTIAKALHSQISGQFEASCFLPNIRELTQCPDGLIRLQQEICWKVMGDRSLHTLSLTPLMDFPVDRMLQRKSVLAICDDVSDPSQLDALFEGSNYQFGPGSRVVVTTRDKRVLKNFQVYEVEALDDGESSQLFCLHAFRMKLPVKKWQKELSNAVIRYAGGNPLVLKVIGSSLCGKNQDYCQDKLNKLRKLPNADVVTLLRISFDGLEDEEEKDIFLDLACFGHLFHYRIPDLFGILKTCYNSVDSAIDDLIDKSLIERDYYGNHIQMHDLIREMGKSVVYQECKAEPGRRSWVWKAEDVIHVLTNDTGTETIRGIVLDVDYVSHDLQLSPTAFVKMHGLKFLFIYYDGYDLDKGIHLSDGLQSLPNELRLLYWEGYPLKSLPSKFNPRNLVQLNMSESHVEQLWEGDKDIPNLKVLVLDGCKNLITVPDLSSAKYLEVLSARDCEKLMTLPSLNRLISLGSLHLNGSLKFNKFPEISSTKIQFLDIGWTAIQKVPSSISCLSALRELKLSGCRKLKRISNSICKLKSLKLVQSKDCLRLERFPEISETMGALGEVDLSGTSIKELSFSIVKHLPKLQELNLNRCENLEHLPNGFHNLKSLRYLYLRSCRRLKSLPAALPVSLVHLDAHNCTLLKQVSSIRQLIKQVIMLGDLSEDHLFLSFSNCFNLMTDDLWHGIKYLATSLILRQKDLHYLSNCLRIRMISGNIPLVSSFALLFPFNSSTQRNLGAQVPWKFNANGI